MAHENFFTISFPLTPRSTTPSVEAANHLLRAGLLLLALLAACASSPLEGRLQQFLSEAKSRVGDDELLRALEGLNSRIRDSDLPRVEEFALEETSRPAGFAFVRLLIDRDRFAGAARVALKSLEGRESPAYAMWKWWDANFGNRPNSKELSLRFVDGLLIEFERGTAARRLLIATLFSKGEAESRLSVAEFKRVISYPQ